MPHTKEGGSVFKTLEEHDSRISTVEKYGDRITTLEEAKLEQERVNEHMENQIKEIKANFTGLENTIWKTAQATQDMMSTQNAQQWDLIKTLNGNNEKDRERKHEYKKSKMEKMWENLGKWGLALLGSGSIIIAMLELLTR